MRDLSVLTPRSILSVNPVLPQAQFVELMIQQFCSVCLASAATILQLYCVIKAREHTSPPPPPLQLPPPTTPPPPVPYNSSASAVAAVWLVVLIFLVCYVRSARPQLLLPCINFTVVVVVTSSLAPTLPTMSVALTFAKQLLVINLTGLALSLAINMLVWPTTNRQSFKRDVGEWQKCVERCLVATNTAVFKELGTELEINTTMEEKTSDDPALVQAALTSDTAGPMQELFAVVDRMKTDLRYSQHEISMGKLSAIDLSKIDDLLYGVLQPIVGLMSGAHVRDRVGEISIHAHRQMLLAEHIKATEAQGVLIDILRHALRTLEVLLPAPKQDEEARDVEDLPALTERVRGLIQIRHTRIEDWQQVYSDTMGKGGGDNEQSLLFVVLEVRRLPLTLEMEKSIAVLRSRFF